MKKNILKIMSGAVLICVLIIAILFLVDKIGIPSSKIEADIRSEQKIEDDWTVDGSVSDTTAAYISYSPDKSSHAFSVYVNRPGLSFGYFFHAGGSLSGAEDGITEYKIDESTQSAFFSMNSQQVAQIKIGGKDPVIEIDSTKPFAIVLPVGNDRTVTFYDVNGNIVEYESHFG